MNVKPGRQQSFFLERLLLSLFTLIISIPVQSAESNQSAYSFAEIPAGWKVRQFEGKTTRHGINHRYVRTADFSADGKLAVSGGQFDDTVKLWDVRSGDLIRTLAGHENQVSAVVFTADRKYVVSGSWDRSVKTWDAERGTLVNSIQAPSSILCLAVSKDGRLAAAGLENGSEYEDPKFRGLILLEIKKRKPLRLMPERDDVIGVVFASGGKRVVSFGRRTLKSWPIEARQDVRPMSKEGAMIAGFSSDGNCAIFQEGFTKLKVIDLRSGRIIGQLGGTRRGLLSATAISPDGRYAAAANDYDRALELWNVTSGKLIGSVKFNGNQHITALAFAPDGKTFIAGTNSGLMLHFEPDQLK